MNPAQDHQYDIILPSVSKINQKSVAEARRNRADRIQRETGQPCDARKIPNTDLVFRIMTWEHIPQVPKKPAKPQDRKSTMEELFEFEDADTPEPDLELAESPEELTHVRVNFPPFFHYRIDPDRVPYLVGKSHWRGDLDTGEFDCEHGTMTKRLATMFLKLCERYATRSNWRGYCVDDQTQALTQRGWLDIHTITEDDVILSYDQGALAWSDIKSIYRGEYQGLMHYITSRSVDSLITPEHKLVTARGLVKIEHVKSSDRIVVMGSAVPGAQEQTYSDAFVELAGWAQMQGEFLHGVMKIRALDQPQTQRIRECLQDLKFMYDENHGEFTLGVQDAQHLRSVCQQQALSMAFVMTLTDRQRRILMDVMCEQQRPDLYYTQADSATVDVCQALVTVCGWQSKSWMYSTGQHALRVFPERANAIAKSQLDFHGGQSRHGNRPTQEYQGWVWCPETEYGSFVARRSGKVFLTGNTYNEEMRGQALLQLAYIGLRFDESKSQNPFSYYTAVITNSFTRILNLEKKNQNIRDDILEMNGLNPSWTRQNSARTAAELSGPVTTITQNP